MDDLISRFRDYQIEWLTSHNDIEFCEEEEKLIIGFLKDTAESFMRENQSTQKKGHWNFVGDNLFECTCCGKIYTTQQLNGLRVYDKDPYCPFFCPNCGADMRGENDG